VKGLWSAISPVDDPVWRRHWEAVTDTLDIQIRMLVTELMDAAPQAPSVADIDLLLARRSLDHDRSVVDDIGPRGSRRRSRHFRLAAAGAVAAVIVVVAGLLVLNGGGAPPGGRTDAQTGTWKLMDDQLKGTWQQNTKGGPPPGSLSCPTTSTCYAMSGTYYSPSAGAPLLSLALYVSTDLGATWTAFRMPHGFAPTSDLACGAVSDCAAGGTYNGKPALLATTDGGHSFSINPLPVGAGHLDTLSCTSSGFCAGLAADSEALNVTPTHATFLSTNDGGKTFTDAPILADDSMQSLACSSSLDCTAVGWNDALGSNDITAGVAARTTDGGQTWTAGALPAGFGISYLSQLACSDAENCSVSGTIAISVGNPPPPHCLKSTQPEPPQGATSPTIPSSVQGPAVRAISQAESASATRQEFRTAEGGQQVAPCGGPSPRTSFISDIASTTDGGLTWTPDVLPTNVPEPMVSGLSCPTKNECWAAGSEAVAQHVGETLFGASTVVLGTTDGGSTWSKVTFSVPRHVQTYNGKTGEGIGSIECPSAGTCVALGVGTQSAPSIPTYSLVVPGSN
jgi:photosystem II stability/assembly factor-like uncharacterized protein